MLANVVFCLCPVITQIVALQIGFIPLDRQDEKLAIDEDTALTDCAPEICRRLDALLVGKLWKRGENDEL